MCFTCSFGALFLAAITLAESPVDASKLSFKQDGNNLIVSLAVTANNSPHVLWKHSAVHGKTVRLRYYVLQNRDRFVGEQKTINVQWWLINRKKDDFSFLVEEKFEPNTVELRRLRHNLKELTRKQKNPVKKKRVKKPIRQKCHPGCFPAGTMVQTPKGPMRIEKLGVGNLVVNVPNAGKPNSLKITSVFVGESELVEVATDKGPFLATAEQPFLLSTGKLKSVGALTGKDEVVCWHNGQSQNTKVRGVTVKDKATVYNLVLEVRGTFVANGFLVQSKPPAEK